MAQRFMTDLEKRPKFTINDDVDILTEILKRLDGRSLCVAACVCRLWRSVSKNDDVWEHLCFRRVSPRPQYGVRPVVAALGGYRRLYMVCIRRLGRRNRVGRRAWTRQEVELSLSLFCIDYYERLGGKVGDASALSLMFLSKPVNV
ncbi:F-box protein SNE-like [Impatiens glandulifera]|uniref:F-box protein SNE-like n=1 Tax=Impatiens glandulifera TaxID=253017 RepID=UPI001FB145A3|nr:F-box protein SNE-like [Impatiens glandulifera]